MGVPSDELMKLMEKQQKKPKAKLKSLRVLVYPYLFKEV